MAVYERSKPESQESVRLSIVKFYGLSEPTALDERHCGNDEQQVQEDVSLVCTDGDPGYAWCQPLVAHFHWDQRTVLSRILSWANNISRGREDKG